MSGHENPRRTALITGATGGIGLELARAGVSAVRPPTAFSD
jgi:NAD(P)-dependent dehydrogenase (short-subunit alcohol dehydrogenase family)